MKTTTRKIQAETAPFALWGLYKDETTFYNRWCLEWFEDYRQTDNIDLWDNDEWLQDLFDGEKKHKKEFKQFVKKHYTNVYWKEVYKEFKEIWELKDRLNKPKKGSFEVGKYYHYTFKDITAEFYFKVTKIKDGGIWGYGLDGKSKWCSSIPWCRESAYENVKEITQEQFLEKVREYAVDTLGFKGEATFQLEDLSTHTIAGGRGVYVRGDKLYVKNQELNSICIFSDGKFAEIVEDSPISDWQPTMELRWKIISSCIGEFGTPPKVLQQKWVNNSGNEEWRGIETEL